jgi:hypothetical protein
MRKRYAALTGGLAALMICVAAAPANATGVYRGQYENTDSYIGDSCGFTVQVESESSGAYSVRTGTNRNESYYFLSNNYTYRNVYTNPANGKSFVLRGNGIIHDTRATRVEGTIFEIASIEAGQPFTLEDSAGNVVLQDHGVVRFRMLVDTYGDAQPGGIILDIFDVQVSGPHESFDAELCQVVDGLIGS